MSGDGRDESSGAGDATVGGPVPPQVPSQGGRASVPPGGHGADGSVPRQRAWCEDDVLPPPRELPPSDADLIDRMRSGDDAAYEELYRRHAQAVRRYARTCCRDAYTADDLTAEVFARMLQAVRGGSGPEHAVRAYLLTSVRRVAASWTRSARREQLVDDFAVFAAQSARGSYVSDDDTLDLGADVRAMHEAERSMAMRAFRSLPERWQAVLWHTEVEDESPSEVATLFGLDANGTRVLASRAREGLKQAYLQAHVSATLTDDEECARYADQLGTYARGRLRTRAERGLRKHLQECAKCRLAATQIEEVAGGIPAVVPVAVIGWFGAAGYAKTAGLIAGGAGAGAAGAAGAASAGGASAGGGSSGEGSSGGGSSGEAAAGAGSTGGAAGGGSSSGTEGGAVPEGVGAPVKAGIAAGVVAVGVAAAVVLALVGDEKPKDEARATPTPSSPVIRPVEPTPTPSRREPGPRPPAIVPARVEKPAPAPATRTIPASTPSPAPTATATTPPSASPSPTPPPVSTPTPTPAPPPPPAEGPPAPAVCVYFSVYADGVRLWRSGLVEGGDPAVPVQVNLTGSSTVRLVVEISCR
ncbi:sigma-70 family RNA polymerase sigma factor [Streptomyces caelestis]|uniref:sigma-70 family RNA polymerase sigma factor n=1 Tax=Streptomyces caelestis TaxID=36816 RepID=UPI0037FB84F1